MSTLHPFRALRPQADAAPRVAAPPYDVIDAAEARALARGNRDSFLRISRPEIDLPEGSDEHAPAVYAQARSNLAEFEARGVLRADAEPRLYLYAQQLGAQRQVGLVGCVAVRDYLDGTIRKHEETRPDKEDDRTRHIDALSAHDEPVFLTYRARPAIDAAVREATLAAPEVDFAELANPLLVEVGLPPMNYNIALREHRASTEAVRLDLVLVSPPGDWFALIDPLNRVDLGTGKKIAVSPDGKIFCGLTLEEVETCLAKQKAKQS